MIKEKFNVAMSLIYDFIKNPFGDMSDKLDDDKNLVFIASILSGFTVTVKALNQANIFNESMEFIYIFLIGLILAPLLGLLTVHLKGAIFHLYLKHIASLIFNVHIDNSLFAKQIQTFVTLGFIVSAVPSLSLLGSLIGLIIEFIGLYRLFQFDLLKAALVAISYHVIWWIIIFLITKGATWL